MKIGIKQKNFLLIAILLLFSHCGEEKKECNSFYEVDFSVFNAILSDEVDNIISSDNYINKTFKIDTLSTVLPKYRTILKDSLHSEHCDSLIHYIAMFEVIESPYFEANDLFDFSYFAFVCIRGFNQSTTIAFWTNNDSISIKSFELHESSWEMLNNLYFKDGQFQEFSDSTLAVNPTAEYYLGVSTLKNDKCVVRININPSWSEDNYLSNIGSSNNAKDKKAIKYIKDLKNFFISTGNGIPF